MSQANGVSYTPAVPVALHNERILCSTRLHSSKVGSAAKNPYRRHIFRCVDMMKILARACGHSNLSEFALSDLVTPSREMAD